MFSETKKTNIAQFLFRWTARALSIATTGVLMLFLFGEKFEVSRVTGKQWVGLLFFPLGITVGLVIAWWKEGLGGAINVGSLAAFYLIYGLLLNEKLGQGWPFAVFAVPGVLFLISWMLSRNRARQLLHT